MTRTLAAILLACMALGYFARRLQVSLMRLLLTFDQKAPRSCTREAYTNAFEERRCPDTRLATLISFDRCFRPYSPTMVLFRGKHILALNGPEGSSKGQDMGR